MQTVMVCFHRLDFLVSKALLFDTCPAVVVPYIDLTNEEHVPLVIRFKVQEKRPKDFWFPRTNLVKIMMTRLMSMSMTQTNILRPNSCYIRLQ